MSITMYREDAVIQAHPAQVELMKSRGWSTTKPRKTKKAKGDNTHGKA